MGRCQILAAGRERRQLFLKELLQQEGYQVDTEADMAVQQKSPAAYDVILLPIPETKQYFIKWHDVFHEGQRIFGCNFPAEAEKQMLDCVDYMKEHGVAEKNAVATAEGAIAEAITLMTGNIEGSKSLVAGYGRCGSIIAEKLLALKSQVVVLEQEEQKCIRAMEVGCGRKEDKDLSAYDLIINTTPGKLFDRHNLKSCKKEVVLLDIATKPGGVDFAYCEEKNITAKLCPGIPGKYAPKAAAQILVEVVKKYVKE